MKSKLISDENGLKTWVLVFDKDDEVRKSLLRFASENGFKERRSPPLALSGKSPLASLIAKRRAIRRSP
jgi:hypothetical protein